jgi:hypothetical protein
MHRLTAISGRCCGILLIFPDLKAFPLNDKLKDREKLFEDPSRDDSARGTFWIARCCLPIFTFHPNMVGVGSVKGSLRNDFRFLGGTLSAT